MVARRIRIGAAASEDALTTAWANAVVSAGGAVGSTQRANVDALAVSLRAASLHTKIAGLWLLKGESDAKQATIDLINLTVSTKHGTVTLANSGATGNGSDGYYALNINPTTFGGILTQDSISVGVGLKASPTGFEYLIAGYDGSALCGIANDSGTSYGFINNTTSANVGDPAAANWLVSRTASTTLTLYKNDTSVATNNTASSSLLNREIFGLARNNQGTADLFLDKECSFFLIAAGLSGTDVSNFNSAIATYLAA